MFNMNNKNLFFLKTAKDKPLFSKNEFGKALKHYRIKNNYSQKGLVDVLSLSHVSFQDVTQSMISLWESQKRSPSLLKRVCIANFFLCDYIYSSDEILKIKKIDNYKNPLIHNDNGYRLTIDNVTRKSIDTLDGQEREKIFDYHQRVYNENLESACYYDIVGGKVEFILYFSANLLVGHIVRNTDYIISIGSQNQKVRYDIIRYLSQDYCGLDITFPVLDHSFAQFIEDSNSGILFVKNNRIYTTCNLFDLLSNPMIFAFYKGYTDFKFLRYAELLKRSDDIYSRLIQLTH